MKKKCIWLLIGVLFLSSLFPGDFVAGKENTVSSKIDPALEEWMNEASPEDLTSVYVILYDLDHEAVMKEFQREYPDDYDVYMKVKNSHDFLTAEIFYDPSLKFTENPDIDTESCKSEVETAVLQQAIARKRQVYSGLYQEHNKVIYRHCSEENVLFFSSYSPMLIVRCDKQTIEELSEDYEVYELALCPEVSSEESGGDQAAGNEEEEIVSTGLEGLALANEISMVNHIHGNSNCKGAGIIIGQIEAGVPDRLHSDLYNQDITLLSPVGTGDLTHATRVARILVGENYGIAPDASLLSIIGTNGEGFQNTYVFYNGIETLLSRGVNIINISFKTNERGSYDITDKWLDHIAMLHDVHCVILSGNIPESTESEVPSSGDFPDPLEVKTPGMSYNGITVGSFSSNGTVANFDDEISAFSSYIEVQSGAWWPEKPNLVACGENLFPNEGSSVAGQGTSFAAPQVAGVIADLCSYCNALLLKQSTVGAMIAAGSPRKVDGYYDHGDEGDYFISSVQVDGNDQISDKEGAGKLDACWLKSIIDYNHFWSATVSSSSFAYEKEVYINASLTSISRVGIFWLKQNSLSGSHSTDDGLIENDFSDLDLYIFDPNGNRVGYSITEHSNYEIVQFWPEITGNYTICITKWGGTSTPSEVIGIALW